MFLRTMAPTFSGEREAPITAIDLGDSSPDRSLDIHSD